MDELIPDTESTWADLNINSENVGVIKNMTTHITPPYHISLSDDSFDDTVDIETPTRGRHPSLGLLLQNNTSAASTSKFQIVQLLVNIAKLV